MTEAEERAAYYEQLEREANHEMELYGFVSERLFKTAHDVIEALTDRYAYFLRDVHGERPSKYPTWSDDAQFMERVLIEMLAEEIGLECKEVK